MRSTKFLKIYSDLAKSSAHPDDLEELYWALKFSYNNDEKIGQWFQKSSPTDLDKGIAIDAVANAIHEDVKVGNTNYLHRGFPGAGVAFFKDRLDDFRVMEKTSEIRQVNRGYYTPLLATEGLIFLAKEQVGKSSKEDIKDAIAEYERLFEAGVGSPAELLTLSRYYGPKSKYTQVAKEQGLHLDENEPLVVGGPASVEGIDHENHLITTEALDVAFDAFMKNFRTRNCMVFHSDVQTGWALPAYITKTGKVFKSGVDQNGFFLVSELRSDTRVAKRLVEEVIDGNILSYSIAGSATDIEVVNKGVQRFMQVNALELAEVTYCEKGVNQGAHFNILKSQQDVDVKEFFPNDFPVNSVGIYQVGNEVLIKADQESSTTDIAYLDLRKFIPTSIAIRVSNLIPDTAVLLNKEYETNWYNNLITNYPEFNNTPFSNYVQDKSGYAVKDFKDITRPDMDRIAVDYMKDAGAIKPEFSSAYVQKEENLGTRFPEYAAMIDGDIFHKQFEVATMTHMEVFKDMMIQLQWQDPKMEYASNWEESEKDRRDKLKEFQKELGFPEDVVHDQQTGFPEVIDEDPLPWNKTDGIVDKS